jgi:hypothetical protein
MNTPAPAFTLAELVEVSHLIAAREAEGLQPTDGLPVVDAPRIALDRIAEVTK